MRIIDAHQHYWLISRADYGWLTEEAGILFADYLPAQLVPELKRSGVAGTIVVQAAAAVEETEYLLQLAIEPDHAIAGVVGWLDLSSTQFQDTYRSLRKSRHFVGIRPHLPLSSGTEAAEIDWTSAPYRVISSNLSKLASDNFPIDLLVGVDELPALGQLLKHIPSLNVVINHCASPDIQRGEWQPWAERMSELALYPNVSCKLSGLATRASVHPSGLQPDELAPYMQHLLNVFGPSRLLYGSDWPVSLQACSYEEGLAWLLAALPAGTSHVDREAIFYHNAVRIYGLAN